MRQTDEKYLAKLRKRYGKASKKERSLMLDEFVKTTGYNRKYASAILSGKQKRAKGPVRRLRKVQYGDVELPRLYRNGFLQVSPGCYEKLMRVSPATIDRLLKGRRLSA